MFDLRLSTLIFQIVNFLVLLGVLTWFFYRPLRRTMQRREEAIAARVREAEERARQAEADRAQLARDRAQATAEADALLADARAKAAREQEQFLADARNEAIQLRDTATQRIQEEERAAQSRLEAQARQTALAIAGSLIREAAGPEVHRALLERSIAGSLPGGDDAQALIRRALASASGPITIETAYPLQADQENRLRHALVPTPEGKASPAAVDVRVEPSLLAGVRIVIDTVAIDASLRHALEELDEREAP